MSENIVLQYKNILPWSLPKTEMENTTILLSALALPRASAKNQKKSNARSAPTHIGSLPNNLIRKIDGYTGRKDLSRMLHNARTLRSLKGQGN